MTAATDHTIVIGRALRMDVGPAEPRVFYQGRFGGYRAPTVSCPHQPPGDPCHGTHADPRILT
ncbi:hypothetical protein [Streptomyces mayonensis]|uniref:hypothetical protein n=1 Tax=Streptomyces mayonensis TaxID=2750816 RepID=UPI001C1E1588|nr:hypothetical protein [Streptomyces sp. A108]MBU6529659.1 hypothetical protein [Streptomyces sp. A108]